MSHSPNEQRPSFGLFDVLVILLIAGLGLLAILLQAGLLAGAWLVIELLYAVFAAQAIALFAICLAAVVAPDCRHRIAGWLLVLSPFWMAAVLLVMYRAFLWFTQSPTAGL